MNLKLVKTELREKYKNLRREMPPEEKERIDSKIERRVVNLWAFRESKVIIAYISKKIEVDTSYIIETAFSLGKKVAVPRCVEGTREMEFFLINSRNDLEKGSYGLLEPVPERCEKLTDFSDSLCIVPAIAFDMSGYRLGFGKGYYDRFLSRFPGKTAGICYSDCVASTQLPHGKYDRCIDMLITENKLHIFQN